jgi:sortase A
MRDDSDTATHGRRATVLRWSERVFVVAGIAMLGWCGLLLADAALSQWEARRSLEMVSLAASVGPPPVSVGPPSPPSTSVLRPGSAIGELTIPRVALGAIILHGSDARTLRRGPGHLENTALPGSTGNVVIAGHRDSFFRQLREVIVGDDIFIDTTEAHLHYQVTSTSVVNPHDLSVLDYTDEPILTLITCYPFWVLGPAPERFVVRAALVSHSSFAKIAVSAQASEEPALAPGVAAVDTSDARVMNEPDPRDDTTLVRRAIERFRVTYNARLVRDHDVRPGGLLEFQSCDVAFADDRAITTCATASPSEPGDGWRSVWTVELERADHGWAIKSIASD